MHSTPYADNSFDGVLLGWFLACSDERSLAAQEIIRITRPRELIAIGIEYNPQSQEQVIAEAEYIPGAKKCIESCDKIMVFFSSAVGHVYNQHVVAPNGLASVGALCVIFSIRK